MVDSEPVHRRAFEELLARHQIDRHFNDEEYGRIFVGIPVRDNIEWLMTEFSLPGATDAILAEREAIYEGLLAEARNLVPMPGLTRLLDELRHRGFALAVATLSPRHQVDMILKGLGIKDRFQAIVAGADVPKPKPAPDVYLKALQELGLTAGDCVAVEDSETGVMAAKGAGLRVIAVPSRYTRRQDLSLADARVESLEQVLDLLT